MATSAPLTIVTGFLGSGKTTLLRALLAGGAGGRRLALVVNEFGQIGLDGAALARAGDTPIVELAGGCVCCEAGSDFLVAVEELLDTGPDQIVVEASGLAEPGGIIRRARGAGLDLDAVVAVADAANLDRALAASPVAAWQLRSADLIVLSKIDLVEPAGRAAAEARLRELNARAAIIPAAHGAVPPDLLFGPRPGGQGYPQMTPISPQTSPPPRSARHPLSAAERGPGGEVGNHDDHAPDPHRHDDGFAAVTWASNEPLRRAALEELLSNLPAEVYRAKGLVHCTDAPWPDEVHLVCGRHSLAAVRLKAPASPLNSLVLLGPNLELVADTLRARLAACADTAERATAWRERYLALF